MIAGEAVDAANAQCNPAAKELFDERRLGLLPIMIGSGTGSEVMPRIAAPMVGGMVSAAILPLIVIPAVFLLWIQDCKAGIRAR